MTEPDPPRFFFIHVMKTGGTSFVFQMLANFEPDEAYPSAIDKSSPTDVTPYASIPKMLALSPERRARVRVYAGHLPYVASELLGFPVVRLTLLRDPVDRAVSMLKHVKRLFERYRAFSLEEIYDDDPVFRSYLDNVQTKVFALTVEERERALTPVDPNADTPPPPRSVPLTPARFEQAKANLANVDVVGLNESYGDFLEELHNRFGWWPNGVRQQVKANVSTEDWGIPAALRRRIAEDLAVDREFYEYARDLVAARRRSS